MIVITVIFFESKADTILNNLNIIKIENFYSEDGETDLKYRKLFNKEIKEYNYYRNISEEEFLSLGENTDYHIAIYKFAARSYEIYFNDVKIAVLGDYKYNSNIWNDYFSDIIPSELIKENNTLRLHVYAENEIGLSDFPVIITDNLGILKLNNFFMLFAKGLLDFSISFALITFIFLIFFYFISEKNRKEVLFFALSEFSIFLYFLNDLSFYYMKNDLLSFKKFIISMVYCSVFFVSLAIYSRFKEKITLFLSFTMIYSVFQISFFSNDYYTFQEMYKYLNFLITLNIISWTYSALKDKKDIFESTMIFTGSVMILISSFYDFFNNAMNRFTFFNYSSIGFIYFSFSLIVIVLNDYTLLHNKYKNQKQISEIIYERSIRDPMTKLYNKQHIYDIIKEIKEDIIIYILDVDDFKEINDKFGHVMGDRAILAIAEISHSMEDNNFMCGRFGGDEFLYIIRNSSPDNSVKIMTKVKEEINKNNISVSIGGCYKKKDESVESALENADMVLYKIKKSGKNNIEFL